MMGRLKSQKPRSGFFIVLYDEDTLRLYLDRGIYGFLMNPEYEHIGKYSRHYAALADYACGREGTHVFFFLKRRIHYGGQLIGSEHHGCFYLNGPLSPMGIKADAQLYWDESVRERYKATNNLGTFIVQTNEGPKERCQPYLIRFKDELGYKGRNILSDDLYFKLGEYGHPLPSNTIQGMSFCTLTPGECDILLNLLAEAERPESIESGEDIELETEPIHFEPKFGITKVSEADRESHLEASLAGNPDLFPSIMRPKGETLCRQVPVSPLKPYQMDRADICYYSEASIKNGTLPNTVIELKNKRSGKPEVRQVIRYIEWLKRAAPSNYTDIKLYLFAPSFASTAQESVSSSEFRNQIELVSFEEAERDTKQSNLVQDF